MNASASRLTPVTSAWRDRINAALVIATAAGLLAPGTPELVDLGIGAAGALAAVVVSLWPGRRLVAPDALSD